MDKNWLRVDIAAGLPSGSAVKNLPAVKKMQETWVRSLGQEDPLEECMATHSCILAWRIPWTEETGRLQSMGSHSSIHELPCGSAGKESTCNVGNLGSIPGLGSFPGEGKGYPL